MFCSLLFASWLCFSPAPIVCEPILYDKKAIFTAYTLSVDETDSNPCISAGNHNICEEQKKLKEGRFICASRFLEFHTRIIIEGVGECEIIDRTSRKYADRIDILFKTKEEAIQFGKRTLSYKVIK